VAERRKESEERKGNRREEKSKRKRIALPQTRAGCSAGLGPADTNGARPEAAMTLFGTNCGFIWMAVSRVCHSPKANLLLL